MSKKFNCIFPHFAYIHVIVVIHSSNKCKAQTWNIINLNILFSFIRLSCLLSTLLRQISRLAEAAEDMMSTGILCSNLHILSVHVDFSVSQPFTPCHTHVSPSTRYMYIVLNSLPSRHSPLLLHSRHVYRPRNENINSTKCGCLAFRIAFEHIKLH